MHKGFHKRLSLKPTKPTRILWLSISAHHLTIRLLARKLWPYPPNRRKLKHSAMSKLMFSLRVHHAPTLSQLAQLSGTRAVRRKNGYIAIARMLHRLKNPNFCGDSMVIPWWFPLKKSPHPQQDGPKKRFVLKDSLMTSWPWQQKNGGDQTPIIEGSVNGGVIFKDPNRWLDLASKNPILYLFFRRPKSFHGWPEDDHDRPPNPRNVDVLGPFLISHWVVLNVRKDEFWSAELCLVYWSHLLRPSESFGSRNL